MDKFVIDRDKLELVLKYLGSRPYVEVMEVVPAVQTAKLLKPEEKVQLVESEQVKTVEPELVSE